MIAVWMLHATDALCFAGAPILGQEPPAEPWGSTVASGLAIVFWFALLGSVWGSFFNVVVYRLPRAISIVRPGSHCPACRHPIRLYDNIPLVSWLLLRGQCRDCSARISLRYPIVEAISAVLFAVLAYLELATGGMNLPWPETLAAAPPPPVFWTPLQLLGMCVFHLALTSGLLCAALIEIDRYAVPARLAAVVLAAGLAAPLVWPYLHPVSALGVTRGGLERWSPIAGAIDGLAGLAIGMILAFVARAGCRAGNGFDPRSGLFFGLTALGVFLGWQAAALVAACAAAMRLAVSVLVVRVFRNGDSRCKFRAAWTPWLAAAATVWIVFWRPLSDLAPFTTWQTALAILAFAAATVALASILATFISRGPDGRHL